MTQLQYKEYIGCVEYGAEDECLYGKILFIRDLVTYEAGTAKQLKKEFEHAVDSYLETCEKSSKAPDTPFKGPLRHL